ncbi:MAG: hypothetical protein C5B59_03525 [Bacteroidetes bacterium]|nr:MAG: hypothetical protein C5B59_03525 [Bacteroidota bacterium]
MTKSWILNFCILFSCCISQRQLFGQVYSDNDAAKEKHFIYEVKEIDEFFERFNDDPGSFIRVALKIYRSKIHVDRQRLIKSLFNYEGKAWDPGIINKFVGEVTDKKSPLYLDFYGDDWYAEVECKFKYNSSSIVIPIIMKIEMAQNKGSKWMVVAVDSSKLKSTTILTEMNPSRIKTKCISPTSHATNFVSLKRAFADKENLSNYFENANFKRSSMQEFYNAILTNQIEFLYVIKIRYHFLLGDKWIFTVEDFTREELNSGWLINSMEEVTSEEMASYRNKLLNGK